MRPSKHCSDLWLVEQEEMLKPLCLPCREGKLQFCRMCCKGCSGQEQSSVWPFPPTAQLCPLPTPGRTQSLFPGSPSDLQDSVLPLLCPGRFGEPLLTSCPASPFWEWNTLLCLHLQFPGTWVWGKERQAGSSALLDQAGWEHLAKGV